MNDFFKKTISLTSKILIIIGLGKFIENACLLYIAVKRLEFVTRDILYTDEIEGLKIATILITTGFLFLKQKNEEKK
jgi:hypothetical protein